MLRTIVVCLAVRAGMGQTNRVGTTPMAPVAPLEQPFPETFFGDSKPDSSWLVSVMYEDPDQGMDARSPGAASKGCGVSPSKVIFRSPQYCVSASGMSARMSCDGVMEKQQFFSDDICQTQATVNIADVDVSCEYNEDRVSEAKDCAQNFFNTKDVMPQEYELSYGMYSAPGCEAESLQFITVVRTNVCLQTGVAKSELWGATYDAYATGDCQGSLVASEQYALKECVQYGKQWMMVYAAPQQARGACNAPCGGASQTDCPAGQLCVSDPSCTTVVCEGCCEDAVTIQQTACPGDLSAEKCSRNSSCSYDVMHQVCQPDMCFTYGEDECERSEHCAMEGKQCVASAARMECRGSQDDCEKKTDCSWDDMRGCVPTAPVSKCVEPCGGSSQIECDVGSVCAYDPNCDTTVAGSMCEGCCKDASIPQYPCPEDLSAEKCLRNSSCSYDMMYKMCKPDLCFTNTPDECERSEHCAMEGRQCVASAARMECRGSQDDCEKKTDCSWDDTHGCVPTAPVSKCVEPCGGSSQIECAAGSVCAYDPNCDPTVAGSMCEGCCEDASIPQYPCPEDLSAEKCLRNSSCSYDMMYKMCQPDHCYVYGEDECERSVDCAMEGRQCVASAARMECRGSQDDCEKKTDCSWDDTHGCVTTSKCPEPCGGSSQIECAAGLVCAYGPNCDPTMAGSMCEGCCEAAGNPQRPCPEDLSAEKCLRNSSCSYDVMYKMCQPDHCYVYGEDECERSEHCAMEGKQCVASAARMECRGSQDDCEKKTDCSWDDMHGCVPVPSMAKCPEPCGGSAQIECAAGLVCYYDPNCSPGSSCEGCCEDAGNPQRPCPEDLSAEKCSRNSSCLYDVMHQVCQPDMCFTYGEDECERSEHCAMEGKQCVASAARMECRGSQDDCEKKTDCSWDDMRGCVPVISMSKCPEPCGGSSQIECDVGSVCAYDPNCDPTVAGSMCEGCCKDASIPQYPCPEDLSAEKCLRNSSCSYDMMYKMCKPDLCFTNTPDECERSEHCAMEGRQCVASAARMECRGSQDDCEKKTDCSWDDVKGCSPMGTMQPTCDKPCGGIAGIQCDTGLSCMYGPACNNMGGSADCMGCCEGNTNTDVCPADLSAGDCMAKMACNYDVRDKACREDMCVRLSHEMCDKTDLCDLDGTRCVPSAARVMCRFEEDACTKMPECAWDAEKGCLPAQVDDVGKVCEGRAADECSDKVCRYDKDAKACAPRMCEFLGKDACAARKYCEYAQDMCRPATCFEAPTMCDDCDPEPAFGSPCVLLANGKPAKGMCTEDAAGAPVCEVMPTFDDDCATVECTVIGASCSDMDKTLNQRGAECLCPFGERNVSGICEANGGDGCSADEMMRCAMSHKTCKKEGTSEAKCVDMTCMDVAQCPDMPSADCTRTGKCPFPCAYTCPSVCTEEEERKCRFEMSASKLPYECRQGGKCETVPCEEVEYVTHFFHGHLLLL